MLNHNLLTRTRSVGLDERVRWNTCRRWISSLINAVDKASRNEGSGPPRQTILNLSEAHFNGQLIAGSLAEEVKAVYPVLCEVRQSLESIVGSSFPIIVSFAYVRISLSVAHTQYRMRLPAMRWPSSGSMALRLLTRVVLTIHHGYRSFTRFETQWSQLTIGIFTKNSTTRLIAYA